MKSFLATILGTLMFLSLTFAEVSDYRQIPFKTITGNSTNIAAFAGKVILIVNTARKCGFTPQYAGLERLYQQYQDRGFVILGFPANNFLRQEPGTDQQILNFCSTQYRVTFPMMSKVSVKGRHQHPLYTYLTKNSPVPGDITWNFNKFLVDRQGHVVTRYGSKVTPDDPQLVNKIEELLAKQ